MENKAYQMYIDGRWCEAASGRRYELPNPATEETIASVPDAGIDDIRIAITAARRAFDEGPWPRSSRQERAEMIGRLIEGLEARKEEFREVLVTAHAAEHITHFVQVDTPVDHLRLYQQLALDFDPAQPITGSKAKTPMGEIDVAGIAYRQPVGVCGLIPTWNFPLYISAQKLGPLLATGCTAVVKPSPFGPLIDIMLAEILDSIGLPPGVINVVTGQGPELGQELTESPLVDKISFTGSCEVGKRVMAAAAGTLKRLHLELGGKSAQIVLDDADLDLQSMVASSPSYFHAGQGCAMNTRVLVSRRRHDELVDKMTTFVTNVVKVGDPADPEVMLGPVIRAERRDAIEEYIDSGKTDGAELATGGRRPAHLERGYFIEPTIFANVRNDMRIAREEIFGPVVSVIPFEDEEDAIRIANDSDYGLFGGIATAATPKATEHAREMAKRIRTGGISINGAVSVVHAPFGGFKQSGLGREGGMFGIHEFTEVQSITWSA